MTDWLNYSLINWVTPWVINFFSAQFHSCLFTSSHSWEQCSSIQAFQGQAEMDSAHRNLSELGTEKLKGADLCIWSLYKTWHYKRCSFQVLSVMKRKHISGQNLLHSSSEAPKQHRIFLHYSKINQSGDPIAYLMGTPPALLCWSALLSDFN